MIAKIEWYQEMLELEPSSRVFFPLAKLFMSINAPDKAITTLQQGLEHHPDFLEARLFLIEVLFAQGLSSDLTLQVQKVGRLLEAYPAFLEAWAGLYAAQNNDLGLSMRFMAAALRQPDLSFSRVLSKGLESVLGSDLSGLGRSRTQLGQGLEPIIAAESQQTLDTIKSVIDNETSMLESIDPKKNVIEAKPREFAAEGKVAVKPEARSELESVNKSASLAPVSKKSVEVNGADKDIDEESAPIYAVRTKSLAEVLASQGDIATAVEIYEELSNAASNPKDIQALQDRITELKSLGNKAAPQVNLVNMLETLASRLEARAHV